MRLLTNFPLGQRDHRRLREIDKLREALYEIFDEDEVKRWMEAPNKAFSGATPVDLIARGDIGELWRMVFYLRSGLPA